MLSFRLNNCNLRSSSCSVFFRILILTSWSSFKCFSYTFSMSLSLCPCSLTVSELQFGSLFALPLNGFLLACSLKFSCHFPIQPSYLGALEGTKKLTIRCLSPWCHLKHQGCVHWLGFYTREGFSFPSISVISSSTSVHSIAPPQVLFCLAYLALVADDKPSHFFFSCSLVLGGNPAVSGISYDPVRWYTSQSRGLYTSRIQTVYYNLDPTI